MKEMKNWPERVKENILTLVVSGVAIVFVWFLLSQWTDLSLFFKKVWNALTPFLFGFVITFVVLPLRRIIEDKLLGKWDTTFKRKRHLSVAIAMILFAFIFGSFFMLLIPQLSSSVATLINNMDGYMATLRGIITHIYEDSQFAPIADAIYENLQSVANGFVSGTAGIVARIVGYSVSVVSGIFDFFVGMIIAVYLLNDSEKFSRQIQKVIYSIFPVKVADHFVEIGQLTTKMLNSFVFGKALDSLIIGIVCYVVTALLEIPYAPLVSFIVGLTNMIPVFGPFIGAIPSIFILLIISPAKALEFGIFIIVLQQIDGNILGPYILGDSMGLPAIWIMFSILVGGGIFGIVGMFLAVPIFSVIYVLATRLVRDRLQEKNITI